MAMGGVVGCLPMAQVAGARQVTDSPKPGTLNLARTGTAGTAGTTPRAVPKNRRASLTSKGTGMLLGIQRKRDF